jgi:methyl-accepting chemotaxis protein
MTEIHNISLKKKFTLLFGSLLLITATNFLLFVLNFNDKTEEGEISFFIVLTLLILSFIIIAGGIYLVLKFIANPIKNLLPHFMNMSNGIIGETVEVIANDEIGALTSSFNKMNKALSSIIKDVKQGAQNIADGSEHISSASQQMSQGATEQAGSIDEISASIEEMSATIQMTSENAIEAEKISREAELRMQEMNQASTESLTAIREITSKIQIINDIAFQTNILALNAAVEAARAGDHGKGFSVVAAEVRKLAERSNKAAEEIMILSARSVSTTENVQKISEILTPEVIRTTKLVAEISASAKEQSVGTEQINQSIQQLNQVTQDNAASAEELASSSEEFASQAEQLEQTISFFSINEGKSKYTSQQKVLIQWGSQYMLNINLIDSQHKVLVEIINKLYDGFGRHLDKKQMRKIVNELVDYTVYHFGVEEDIFQKIGYKETTEHNLQHKMFVDKIKQFAEEVELGDMAISIDITEFLKNWLINHILKTDKRYVETFKANGIK